MQRIIRISKTLIPKLSYIASRSYYTNRHKKLTLYTKISPLGSPSVNLTPELDDWVEKGNKVRFAELQRIILDLRKRKRFSQALQVDQFTHVCVYKIIMYQSGGSALEFTKDCNFDLCYILSFVGMVFNN